MDLNGKTELKICIIGSACRSTVDGARRAPISAIEPDSATTNWSNYKDDVFASTRMRKHHNLHAKGR